MPTTKIGHERTSLNADDRPLHGKDPGRVDFRGEQLQTKAVPFEPFAPEDMLSLINEVFEP